MKILIALLSIFLAAPAFAQDVLSFKEFQEKQYGKPNYKPHPGPDFGNEYQTIQPYIGNYQIPVTPAFPDIYRELDDDTFLPDYQKKSISR